MTEDIVQKLKDELELTKHELEDLREEAKTLKRAVWDMLNFSPVYVVLLDRDMNISLINNSLATDLGFKDEKEPLGMCWGDFIPGDTKKVVLVAHANLAFKQDKKYREVTNDIMTLEGKRILVKWFNFPINSGFNMTFSIGIPRGFAGDEDLTEDRIRRYYSDILERDAIMIKSIKDSLEGLEMSNSCMLRDDEEDI
jgi:PAS domain-containing protein